MLRANLVGLPLFLMMMSALVLPFILSRGLPAFILGVDRFVDLRVFIPWIAAGTMAHEGLHGLGWMAAGKRSYRSVRFGFHWKTLTPYAHFTEPITASAYRIGIVLPGFIVGFAPAVAGYVIDNPAFVLFGGMFFGAAAGDALGLWAVRNIPAETLVLDHPSRVGCTIVSSPEIRL
ncbi:MAG TPA: DUF3267 domain-containing protein [Bacteroidota bacterium]|nr:DUF3267 domain-containing protein [Bacteroidota bacterium]